MNAQLHKMYREITADRRKLTVIVVLLVIGLFLWGRLLLDQGPDQAEAQPSQAVESAMDDLQDLKLQQAPPEAGRPTVKLTIPKRLPRDPFAGQFLKAEQNFQEKQAKSPEKSADTPDKAPDPSGLALQSVMQGARPRAMINGTIIAEGESIQGFTLRRVANRYVVLEKNGQQVRLAL
jgi:hypothetical protein